MGIIELLNLIGEENCNVQSIPQNIVKWKTAKGQAEITFVTAPENAPDLLGNHENMGLVIWVNKEVFDKAMEKAKEKDNA